MKNQYKKISRRNFLKTGLAIAGITLPSFFNKPCKGDEIYKIGKLKLVNHIADIGIWWPLNIIHRQGAL